MGSFVRTAAAAEAEAGAAASAGNHEPAMHWQDCMELNMSCNCTLSLFREGNYKEPTAPDRCSRRLIKTPEQRIPNSD
jgi:hypothetical protein